MGNSIAPHYIQRCALKVASFITAITLMGEPLESFANPQGGVVNAGSAVISSMGKTLTVTQSSASAVIDWKSFNIDPDQVTRFLQPSSTSLTLNRVNDMNPSHILGTVTANGNIVLVNPNGVFFGKNSTIDVGGLIASTANISNTNLMAGNLDFNIKSANSTASIINDGSISAKDAGLVGFVAPEVENNGTITAQMGKVTLAAGESFAIDMAGDELINIQVSDKAEKQLAANNNTMSADGGTLVVTAATAKNLVSSVVSTGAPAANSFKQEGGKIILFASNN